MITVLLIVAVVVLARVFEALPKAKGKRYGD